MTSATDRRPNAARAFTLIEVLVAVTILAVGIAAVLEALGRAAGALDEAAATLQADSLLREKLAEAVSGGRLAADASGSEGVWSVRLESGAVPLAECGDLQQVTLRAWHGSSPQAYVLATYLRRR